MLAHLKAEWQLSAKSEPISQHSPPSANGTQETLAFARVTYWCWHTPGCNDAFNLYRPQALLQLQKMVVVFPVAPAELPAVERDVGLLN